MSSGNEENTERKKLVEEISRATAAGRFLKVVLLPIALSASIAIGTQSNYWSEAIAAAIAIFVSSFMKQSFEDGVELSPLRHFRLRLKKSLREILAIKSESRENRE